MSKTIIVVDAEVLRGNPLLNSKAWKRLHSHVDDWQLRFLVPEVAHLEAVNGAAQSWEATQLAMSKPGSWFRRYGLAGEWEAMVESAQRHVDGYESSLRARFDELGVEVVPIPDTIDHLDIARRSAHGLAPYAFLGDAVHGRTKDGYRDTLIWITVLEVAAKHSDCDVWFVSNNYTDFGVKPKGRDHRDSSAYPLDWHADLATELEHRGLAGRVFYARDLDRLESHLSAEFSPLSSTDRDALWDEVDQADVDHHLTQALYSAPVDPRLAALPLETAAATVSASVRASDSVHLTEAAKRAANAWTARYSCEVQASIEVVKRSGDITVERKPLVLSGQIELDSENKVTALTVESIEARDDDPQHRAWERLGKSVQAREYMDTLRSLTNPGLGLSEALREQLNPGLGLSEALREQLNPGLGLSEALRSLTNPGLGLSEALREQLNPGLGLSEALRGMANPTPMQHQPDGSAVSGDGGTPDAEDPDPNDDHADT